jgi:hypothetical protein
MVDMRKSITLLLLLVIMGMGAGVKGQLMITEIMYQSPAINGGMDSLEYVEFYNYTNAPINMTGYTISGGITFTFPNYTVDPGDFFIVARNPTGMGDYFGSSSQYVGIFAGNLSNVGEAIVLKNGTTVVDSVFYSTTSPWPAMGAGDGHSITLCDFGTDNNDGTNWSGATTMVPGGISQGIQLYANPLACCDNADVTAPTIVSAGMSGADQVWIQFSEPLSLTSEWAGNFSAGSSTFASVAMGMTADSMLLTLAAPLANGDYDLIYVHGVEDAACNALVLDSFDVVYNLLQPYMSICEIMYDDPTADDSLEFIELINMELVPIPFGGLRIQGDVNVVIPEITVPSLARLVIAKYPQTVIQAFGPAYQVIGWTSGTLGNTTGRLELWNSEIPLDDTLTYTNTGPWPTGASGTGSSIKMCDPDQPSYLPGSWSLGTAGDFTIVFGGDSIFATPTRENCRLVSLEDPLLESTAVYPNPFHSGFEIKTASMQVVSATVVDALGRQVRQVSLQNGYAKVELGDQPNGIYFVQLSGEAGEVLKTIKMIRL